MSEPASIAHRGQVLLALYDDALPEVYGYLRARCGDPVVAEDLTSETFMAAVDGLRRGKIPNLTTAWLVGVARHKLADHWRARSREDRKLALVETEDTIDDWEQTLDAVRAHEVLDGLGDHHRAALTLRYIDGLGVPEVAAHLGRTLHATEALLVRARNAFRTAYGEGGPDA